MRVTIGKVFGAGALPGFVLMCSAAGYQTYLLEFRPTISQAIPDQPPSNWVCGRAVGPSHCVEASPFERNLLMVLLGLLPLSFVLVAGDLLLRRRSNAR